MIVSSVLQAIGLFIATNIDDIIVLSLFFARGAGQPGTTARIAAGQYLGFAGILGAAVLVSLGAGAFLPPAVSAQGCGRERVERARSAARRRSGQGALLRRSARRP